MMTAAMFAADRSAGAASVPSASASPAGGLTDGQVIAVQGSGFPSLRTIQVEECQGTVTQPPIDNTACDGDTFDGQATSDSHGRFSNSPGDAAGHTGFEVYTLPSVLLHATTPHRCDVNHSCVLYAGVDQNDFTQPHTWIGIRFASTASQSPTAPVQPRPAVAGQAAGSAAPGTATTAPTPPSPMPVPPTSAAVPASAAPPPAPAGGRVTPSPGVAVAGATSGSLVSTGPSRESVLLALAGVFVAGCGAIVGAEARGAEVRGRRA